MEQFTLLFACLFTIALVLTFVHIFRKWVKHEKERDEQVKSEYENSEMFKETKRKFLEKLDKTKKK